MLNCNSSPRVKNVIKVYYIHEFDGFR